MLVEMKVELQAQQRLDLEDALPLARHRRLPPERALAQVHAQIRRQ